jgi:hypothetical protein
LPGVVRPFDRVPAVGVAPGHDLALARYGDPARIANLAESAFWFVLPSLPIVQVLPARLRAGISFWASIGAGCALTITLYFVTAWSLARFGIDL